MNVLVSLALLIFVLFIQLNFEGKAHPDGMGVTFTRDVTKNDDTLPGNIKVEVEYTLDNDNNIMVKMMATTKDNGNALIDMCNSARFNLKGDGSVSRSYLLSIFSVFHVKHYNVFL